MAPIATTDHLIHPTPVSVLYTDSIPLLGIFFRMISAILPKSFQYFGLWGLLCFMLNGATAAVMLRSFSSSKRFCAIGSLFFILSPCVLFRMFGHTSLAAHWLILAAFCIWFYKPFIHTFWKNLWLWCTLFGGAVFIHPYFIPLIGFIFAGYLIDACIDTRNVAAYLIIFCAVVATTLGSLWWLGAFDAEISTAAGGLGFYSANLNFLFNPLQVHLSGPPARISLLQPKLSVFAGQYEGMGYLGTGMIFMGIVALGKLCFRKYRFHIRRSAVLLCAVLLTLLWLAVAPVITFGGHELWRVPYPDFMVDLLSRFRASGRFVWPICYFLFAFFLFMIQRQSKTKHSFWVICIALGLQMIDLSGWMLDTHRNFMSPKQFVSDMQSDIWPYLARRHKHIFTNFPIGLKDQQEISIAKYAFDNDLTLNFYYLTRSHDRPKGLWKFPINF